MPKIEINKERCKGCEYCVLVCPKGVLTMGDSINARGIRSVTIIRPEECTGCAQCAVMCPDVCIEVWR